MNHVQFSCLSNGF